MSPRAGYEYHRCKSCLATIGRKRDGEEAPELCANCAEADAMLNGDPTAHDVAISMLLGNERMPASSRTNGGSQPLPRAER